MHCIAHTRFNPNPLTDLKNEQTYKKSLVCKHYYIYLRTTHKIDPWYKLCFARKQYFCKEPCQAESLNNGS
jgi:hypothetical protein